MKNFEKLKKLHRKLSKGCVSFGINNGLVYYAKSGTQHYNPSNPSKIDVMIQEIIGNGPICCDINDSFTIMEPSLYISPNNKYNTNGCSIILDYCF